MKKSKKKDKKAESRKSHDHNFKNLLLDFPEDTLRLIIPRVIEDYGKIQNIEFLRQEPKKWKLTESHLALDMPILFTFEKQKLLLWLVEFQENKSKFSIYKLARYTIDYMEACPDAVVVPAVMFTDRKKWRKDAVQKLNSQLHERTFFHFEYVFFKLFDMNARDYYHVDNPVVKILLPKMRYAPEERIEVIRRAYIGLFHLTTHLLFDKYVDFIDLYAEVKATEREEILTELIERKETAMLAEYIREQGHGQGMAFLLCQQLTLKYSISPEIAQEYLKGLKQEDITYVGKRIFEWKTVEDVQKWILDRKATYSEDQ